MVAMAILYPLDQIKTIMQGKIDTSVCMCVCVCYILNLVACMQWKGRRRAATRSQTH